MIFQARVLRLTRRTQSDDKLSTITLRTASTGAIKGGRPETQAIELFTSVGNQMTQKAGCLLFLTPVDQGPCQQRGYGGDRMGRQP